MVRNHLGADVLGYSLTVLLLGGWGGLFGVSCWGRHLLLPVRNKGGGRPEKESRDAADCTTSLPVEEIWSAMELGRVLRRGRRLGGARLGEGGAEEFGKLIK